MKITKQQADKLVQKHETFYCKYQKIKDCDVYIYNYLLSDKEAFKSFDNLGTELRGLCVTKDPAGLEHLFWSVPKFFNINETPETLLHELEKKTIKKVQQKLDGSLIQPILLDGEVHMKTKQSFTNIQAQISQGLLDADPEMLFFILDCFANNFYPLFELVGPDNKIVVDYDTNKLVLIAVRSPDGEFIDIDKFDYPIKAESYDYSLQEMLEHAQDVKGIEGYVVKFTDGSLVKIKCLDYIEKHRTVSELDSRKSVLKRILTEDMDDLYSVIPEYRLDEIQQIEQAVTEYVIHQINELEKIVEKGDDNDRRTFVDKYRSHEYFAILMKGLKHHNVKDTTIDFLLRKYSKEQKAREFIKMCLDWVNHLLQVTHVSEVSDL